MDDVQHDVAVGRQRSGQKKYAAASRSSLEGYADEYGGDHDPQGRVRLTQGLERLVPLYEGPRQEGRGSEWRKESEAAKPK